jgi:hypothetical protein
VAPTNLPRIAVTPPQETASLQLPLHSLVGPPQPGACIRPMSIEICVLIVAVQRMAVAAVDPALTQQSAVERFPAGGTHAALQQPPRHRASNHKLIDHIPLPAMRSTTRMAFAAARRFAGTLQRA